MEWMFLVKEVVNLGKDRRVNPTNLKEGSMLVTVISVVFRISQVNTRTANDSTSASPTLVDLLKTLLHLRCRRDSATHENIVAM